MTLSHLAPIAPTRHTARNAPLPRFSLRFLLSVVLLVPACGPATSPQTRDPERALLQTVVEQNPAGDPRLAFLLMGRYASAQQAKQGVVFFESQLESHSLEPGMRALFLSISGALRAQSADDIPLTRRIAWVNTGLDQLDEAVDLTKGELYIVRWLRAIVIAQVPPMFKRGELARAELAWAQDNIDQAPVSGLLRELVFQRARLAKEDGDEAEASELLAQSGYPSFERNRVFNIPARLTSETGFAFTSPEIVEHIPGSVYEARGYDFMEYFFVVSADKTKTIAVDAGSSQPAAEKAVQALRAAHPDLPPISDVLITHAHWDHVGGHAYFRSLPSKPQFHANALWEEQMEHQEGSGGPYERWWGEQFVLEDVLSFHPDHTFAAEESVEIGGTTVRMIPSPGGETRDGALFYLPEHRLLFTGDMIMPYLGAPHADEGSPLGLAEAIDMVAELDPKLILHAHHGINRTFPTTEILTRYRGYLLWLVAEIEARLAQGETRAQIHHQNLIPPGLVEQPADLAVPYLVLRSHVINRVSDQRRGYWQEPFDGADTLTAQEFARAFTHYASVSPRKAAKMIDGMIDAGDYELALRLTQWFQSEFPKNKRFPELERAALLGLVDRYQATDPFKFIWYGRAAGVELGDVTLQSPQMP